MPEETQLGFGDALYEVDHDDLVPYETYSSRMRSATTRASRAHARGTLAETLAWTGRLREASLEAEATFTDARAEGRTEGVVEAIRSLALCSLERRAHSAARGWFAALQDHRCRQADPTQEVRNLAVAVHAERAAGRPDKALAKAEAACESLAGGGSDEIDYQRLAEAGAWSAYDLGERDAMQHLLERIPESRPAHSLFLARGHLMDGHTEAARRILIPLTGLTVRRTVERSLLVARLSLDSVEATTIALDEARRSTNGEALDWLFEREARWRERTLRTELTWRADRRDQSVALTEAEQRVLQLLPSHLSTLAMADELNVSANTVKSHLRAIYRKLGAENRADAVLKAQEHQFS